MLDLLKKKREEGYYLNFYVGSDGRKILGNWKSSEGDSEEEKNSYLYKVKLDLTWTKLTFIPKKEVEELAEKYDMSVEDVLKCIYS